MPAKTGLVEISIQLLRGRRGVSLQTGLSPTSGVTVNDASLGGFIDGRNQGANLVCVRLIAGNRPLV
jgi:hypothetical protein